MQVLKKFFTLGVFGLIVCAAVQFVFTANCSARTLSVKEMYIGGVTFSSNYERIYGRPTRVDNPDSGFRTVYYGDSVRISYGEGQIGSITVTANNGWATPAGIRVGSNIDSAVKVYGDPFAHKYGSQQAVYAWKGRVIGWGGNESEAYLVAKFNKIGGRISEICLWSGSRMADFDINNFLR